MEAKKVVIVESPNKVATIKKYLGDDYDVVASVGHIAKLKTNGEMGLGIDLQTWEPQYEIDKDKRKVVNELKSLTKDAEIVYIATDPDREGEAIGDHLVKYLKCANKYKRIKYNEITKEAILKAISKPGELDQNLINAQKARRMLDRIIGFRLSKLMKQKLSGSPTFPSAGRVQSIALKLIIDRENEIEKFVPVGYNKIEAKLDDDFSAWLNIDKHLSGEKEWIFPEEIENIKLELEKEPTNELVVKDVKESQKRLSAVTPLKQSVLYKKSPFSSRITQSSAQHLYEGYGDGGLISYPRTDSTRLSQQFINQARDFISQKYGKEYILEEIKGFSGDQDAHEAIRPTDINLAPEEAKNKFDLNNYDYQIYKLIYEHTLQALIKPPVRSNKQYVLTKNKLIFKLNSSKVLFDGYYVVKNEKEELLDPNYAINQVVNVKEYVISDHETKPPARYSEGALIEALDKIKVGRPSTFASTVKIVLDRQYAENKDGSLYPTAFGKIVLEKLLSGFPDIINEGYTAEVEEELDLIASNKIAIQPVMEDFYSKFTKTFNNATQTMVHTTIEPIPTDEKCPNDDGDLVIRKNRYGEKFVGCKNFPSCKFTKNYDWEANGEKRKFFKKFKFTKK